jgi:hypothetical protein
VILISTWHYFHSHLNRSLHGKQRLMKKGQGRLSDCMFQISSRKENGRLIICNQEGVVVKDA